MKNHYKVRKQKDLNTELKEIFKTLVFQERSPKLEDACIEMMEYERNGGEINTLIIKNYYEFLVITDNFSTEDRNLFSFKDKISIYLQKKYLKDSNLMLDVTPLYYINYLKWGTEKISYEENKLANYLPEEFNKTLMSEINRIIFFEKYCDLMESENGIMWLFENNDKEVK